jgi:adenosylhomocysteine nucleosidase
MTRTAIIAAMPAELKPLTRGWRHSRTNGVDLWRWSFDGGEWIAACAGAGVQAATRAFAEVEKSGPLDQVISAGWAGALREELAPGQAFDVSAVIDARTGERFLTSCFALGTKALKGHGFSRAVEAQVRDSALAAEGMQTEGATIPQGLKPGDSIGPSIGTAKAMPFQNECSLVTGNSNGAASGTAEQATEKLGISGETDRNGPSVAKAAVDSVGFVRGLKPPPPSGTSFSAGGEVVPFQNKRQCDPQSAIQNEFWLVTSPKVADAHEKLRLAETYLASLVDMEASAIARLAQMRGIPFYCIKGISDGYTDQLPDFNRFISTDGHFQTLRFALFAISSPKHWPALIRMGENSRKAARAIADSLLDLLDKDGQIRKRNGYPNHKH